MKPSVPSLHEKFNLDSPELVPGETRAINSSQSLFRLFRTGLNSVILNESTRVPSASKFISA